MRIYIVLEGHNTHNLPFPLVACSCLAMKFGENPAFSTPSSRFNRTMPSCIVEAMCKPSSRHILLSWRPRPCCAPPVRASWQNHCGLSADLSMRSTSVMSA